MRGILDDLRQIRDRAFHAAALTFRRLAEREGAPSCCSSKTCTGRTPSRSTSSPTSRRSNRDVPLLLVRWRGRRCSSAERTGARGPRRSRSASTSPRWTRVTAATSPTMLLKKLPEVPAALRELVIGGSEGNPFYMEELVRMLIDQGAITVAPERWSLDPARLLAAQVPATLTGVLQARLDRLPPEERETLQLASVIGAMFWDRTLIALDPRGREDAEGAGAPGAGPAGRGGRGRRAAGVCVPAPPAASGDVLHRVEAHPARRARQGGAMARRADGLPDRRHAGCHGGALRAGGRASHGRRVPHACCRARGQALCARHGADACRARSRTGPRGRERACPSALLAPVEGSRGFAEPPVAARGAARGDPQARGAGRGSER